MPAGARAIRVRSWQELEAAVHEHAAAPAAPDAGWAVFQLLPPADGALVATSTVQLGPGMAVVSASHEQAAVTCGQGVRSAFSVQLPAAAGSRAALLQGLSISGCSGSAVVVAGAYKPGMLSSQTPLGLHIQDSTLSGNRGTRGAGVRAERAALFLRNTTLTGNAASELGGAVSISGGLLVGSELRLVGNTAGVDAAHRPAADAEAPGAAVHANGSALLLANSRVADNAAAAIGGCALAATGSGPVVLAGCTLSNNTCRPTPASAARAQVAGDPVVGCPTGGASLLATLGMPAPSFNASDDCAPAAQRHLVLISDSTFASDAPAAMACGGSVLVKAAWLEVSNSSFSGTHGANKGGGLASVDSTVVARGSAFAGLSAMLGGAAYLQACRGWVAHSSFSNSSAQGSAMSVGGCVLANSLVALALVDSELTQCSAQGQGGGMFAGAVSAASAPPILRLERARIANCSAARLGGGVYASQAEVVVAECEFDSNESPRGAAIDGNYGILRVSRSNFTGNRVALWGGAVEYWDASAAAFEGCRFAHNSAYQGGAVYAATTMPPAHWSFTRCTFLSNSASQQGGAVWLQATNASFADSSFLHGKALVGAGLYAEAAGARVTLTLERCSLAGNNAALSGGGARLLDIPQATLRGCNFSANTAVRAAGALHLADTAATISACRFEANAAATAGALMLEGNATRVQLAGATLARNQASDRGGAVAILQGQLAMRSARFASNNATTAGGAVLATARASLRCASDCTFTANAASLGGAIAAQLSAVQLADTELAGNAASAAGAPSVAMGDGQLPAGTGGALFALGCSVALQHTSWRDNTADLHGGAAALLESSLAAAASVFQGNTAVRRTALAASAGLGDDAATAGGALLIAPSPPGTVAVEGCTFAGNSAGTGGALAVVPMPASPRGGAAVPVLLKNTRLANNSATGAGGALVVSSQSTTLHVASCSFADNRAGTSGGGLAVTAAASVQLRNATITANTAASCAGLLLGKQRGASSIAGCRITRNTAGAAALPVGQQPADSALLGALPRWNTSGSGGGGCLVPGSLLHVASSSITGNSGLHGAGLFIEDACPAGAPAARCRVVLAADARVAGNSLLPGGSGAEWYVTNATVLQAAQPHNETSTPRLAGNNTALVAADPFRVAGIFGSSPLRGQALHALVDSGTALPVVRLLLFDQLGQSLPSSLLRQLTLRASAASDDPGSDTQLLGITSQVFAGQDSTHPSHGLGGGTVQFDALQLQGAPGARFNVSFSVLEASDVAPAVMRVQLKPCSVGQGVTRGRSSELLAGCTNCTTPYFSFDPAASCQACPLPETYRRCSGAVITPADGFWQSHPRSAQLHACPYPPACTRSEAAYARMAATARAAGGARMLLATPNASAVAAYQAAQCAAGYAGHLCAMCDRTARVSQTAGRQCKACERGRVASIALFSLARLFDFLVVLLQVWIVLKEVQKRRQLLSSAWVTRLSSALSLSASQHSAGSVFAAPQLASAASVQGVAGPPSSVHAAAGPVSRSAGSQQPLLLADKPHSPASLAHSAPVREHGIETFLALLIEFMQLLSVFRLTRIATVWRHNPLAVLLAVSVTPISTFSWVSIECALPGGLSSMTYALASTLATTFIPLGVVLAVCCVVVLQHATSTLSWRGRGTPLAPKLVLAGYKAAVYGFPVVINAALGLFSCVQLDTVASAPGEVLAAQGRFWSRELGSQCFAGAHRSFALGIGLPVLAVALAYLSAQVVLLVCKARTKPDGLYEPRFLAWAGLLFDDYRSRMFLWSAVRDLRQLLLVALVVLLQAAPVQLQLGCGWLLTLAMLGVHAALAPFRARLLNALQTAMLAAVCFTFYAAVVSGVPGLPGAAAAALQIAAVVLDVAVGVVLLGLLLRCAWLLLDFDQDGRVSWADVRATLRAHSQALSSGLAPLSSSLTRLASSNLRSLSSGVLLGAGSVGSKPSSGALPAVSASAVATQPSIS